MSFARALLIVLIATLLPAGGPPARAGAPNHFELHVEPSGVRLVWGAADATGAALDAHAWPAVEVGGVLLPARLVALRVSGAQPVAPEVRRIASAPWRGRLRPAAQPAQADAAGQLLSPLERLHGAAAPPGPVTVLRDAHGPGGRLVVLAVAPLFQAADGLRLVMDAEAFIADAMPLEAAVPAAQSQATARAAPLGAPAPPTNLDAAAAGWTIRVTQPGIQVLSSSALAAAGLNLASVDRALLRLRRGGAEIALDTSRPDELRFYAPPPGDRWNDTDTYWLTVGTTAGARIAPRDATAADAPETTTALQRGVWYAPTLYDSRFPGPDGDYWYAADFKAGPGLPPPDPLTIPLTPTLPLAGGPTRLTVRGTAYTAGGHQLRASIGAASDDASWSGDGDWGQTFTLSGSGPSATLALIPGAAPDGVEVDAVAWERPVALDFGGQGAFFDGLADTRRYRLSDIPNGAVVYDITDPRAPQRLSFRGAEFQDGPARRYLLAGPGTLQTPAIARHTPDRLSAPLDADTLYIAPAALHGELAPLVAHRQAQGRRVAVVDVQAIYDNWSYGQVAPDAIRAFLRYAAATWPIAPAAVTLVGDGTHDPRNYLRRGPNNVNLVPPYLTYVDPWLGETACDLCYAQLDGDDPRADPLPDLMIGRLPVKSAAELATVVGKIIRYETSDGAGWRGTALFLADNFCEASDVYDSGGDFAAAADSGVALLPASIRTARVYYDPCAPPEETWRLRDAQKAHQAALAGIDLGVALLVYNGHSNHFQLAVTDAQAQPPNVTYLLNLNDVDALANGDRLPVLLQMTCLTSAFQTPFRSGTTFDERMVLSPRGGAIAAWGPTGLGVGRGHEPLQNGFLRALAAAPGGSAELGALVAAGLTELYTQGNCCQDLLHTYVLLGDPRTQMRLAPAHWIFAPAASQAP
jgi:hypothetical protein